MVATLVLLSFSEGVDGVALLPRATVPLNVLLPLIVCVVPSVVNAPEPPIARIEVAEPPAPPVPSP